MSEETNTKDIDIDELSPSTITNRMQAIAVLKKYNVNFNESEAAKDLIARGRQVLAKEREKVASGGKVKMNRTMAVTVLRKANQPFDEKADTSELVKLAKSIPPEKYFTIILQEKTDVTAPAFIGVNGRPWNIVRGEEVVVPERVVTALKNAVSFIPYQKKDPHSAEGKLIIKHKRMNAELFSVLGEVPAP